MNDLANLLKTYRKKSGLTQKQLGARINFNHTVVSRAENPESNYLPTRVYIQQFCLCLQLDQPETDEILGAYEQALHDRGRRSLPEDPIPVPNPAVLEQSPQVSFPQVQKEVKSIRPQKFGGGILLMGLVFFLIFVFYFLPIDTFAKNYAAVVPPGTILYSENFENRNIDDWEFLNNGKWEVFDRSGSAVFGVIHPDPKAIPNAFLTRSLNWDNYTLSTDVAFQSGKYEQIYIVVRNAGRKNNCSGYRIGGNRLGVSIFRFDSIRGDCLGELLVENLDYPLLSGQTYHMRIEAQGAEIRYFINDELILQATDTHYPQGGIGLLAYEVQWAGIDNIQVEKR
jgi:transcriptional regulator with XRE-family HTH domain